jgi:hypothetical protein
MFAARPGQPGTPVRALADTLVDSLRACEVAGARLRLPPEGVARVLIVGTYGRLAISQARRADDGEVDAVVDFADELLSVVFERA